MFSSNQRSCRSDPSGSAHGLTVALPLVFIHSFRKLGKKLLQSCAKHCRNTDHLQEKPHTTRQTEPLSNKKPQKLTNYYQSKPNNSHLIMSGTRMCSTTSASLHPAFKLLARLLLMFVASVFWVVLVFCLVSCCSIFGGCFFGEGGLIFFDKLGVSRESQVFLSLTC